MIVTEEEAGKLWCPAARIVIASDDGLMYSPPYNVLGEDDAVFPAMCQGSKCMWWRWERAAIKDEDTGQYKWEPSTGRGSCGIAGLP